MLIRERNVRLTAEWDNHESSERGDEDGNRCKEEDPAIRACRDNVLFEEQLDAIRRRLQEAARVRCVSGRAGLA